jgi:hypothetical protein
MISCDAPSLRVPVEGGVQSDGLPAGLDPGTLWVRRPSSTRQLAQVSPHYKIIRYTDGLLRVAGARPNGTYSPAVAWHPQIFLENFDPLSEAAPT